jgi:capsular polysaccharide export protein
VSVWTSLAGFEALLRGRIVVTYGQPFYAGWGLTRDQAPLERRRRRLQLEELVAGALILYPLYVDPATGLPCGPEVLVARLAQPEYWRPSLLTRARRIQGRLRRRWPMGPAAPGFMAGPARP